MNEVARRIYEREYIVVIAFENGWGDRIVERMPFRAVSKAHALHKWHEFMESHTGFEWEGAEFEFLSVKER